MADSLARLRRRPAWKKKLDALPTTRSCSGCDLCCTVLEIQEIQKPAWSPCAHLKPSGAGCGIWGDHPDACKNYVCFWRMSDTLLPADMFPALSGFLLTIDDVDTWPATVNVNVDAARPGAWDTLRNRAIFSKLAAAWNCSVAVVGEGARASHVFTPNGVYVRADRPDMFVEGGLALAFKEEDFGPDRRPPRERIADHPFQWDAD